VEFLRDDVGRIEPMKRPVTIPRGEIDLAADLHLPDDFDPAGYGPTVVLSTPASSAEEQIGANYASRLAENGFSAIAFDPAHQGRSGGEPRDLEDPYRRGEVISYAIDYLITSRGSRPSAGRSAGHNEMSSALPQPERTPL
jgi:fermentation-respiration switch protein FrsA (DUF1100 family)